MRGRERRPGRRGHWTLDTGHNAHRFPRRCLCLVLVALVVAVILLLLLHHLLHLLFVLFVVGIPTRPKKVRRVVWQR